MDQDTLIALSRYKLISKRLLRAIAASPSNAYTYSDRILEAPWPEGEAAIASHAKYAYLYARYSLKSPWPKGEPAIATDSHHSISYARFLKILGIIGFPAGEAIMATNAITAYRYAADVLGAPFPKGELTLAKDHKYGVYYVEDVLNLRPDQADVWRYSVIDMEAK